MWTVIYMSQKSEEAENIKKILEAEDIIVKKRRVHQPGEEESFFEILVPSKEVASAHSLIIDAEL